MGISEILYSYTEFRIRKNNVWNIFKNVQRLLKENIIGVRKGVHILFLLHQKYILDFYVIREFNGLNVVCKKKKNIINI